MDDKTKALIDRLLELERIAQQATPGPWCVESLGEKGDGSNVIGVAFGPDDQNAERPLSGWLEPFDKDGNEIDYYRDEEVAACEHRERNAGPNAAYIMTFDPPTTLAMIATICAQAEENERLKALLKQHHDWHLQAGIIGLQDGSGGWIGIDNALEYSDSGMCERTTQALENTPPEEMVPPPRGGIGAEWWQVGILERRKRKTAEAKLHQALEWLKDSKRFVEDAGSDEDPEACRRAVWLISKIDALLTRLANPEPTKTDDPAILHQRLEERICNCGAAGQNEQHEPWCAWQDATRTDRAISALETPDSSLSRVPNTIRQSIKEVIERERSRAESAEAERDALKAELARIKSAEGCDVEGALDAYMDAPNKGLPYDSLVQQRMSAALAAGCAPLRAKIEKMEAVVKAAKWADRYDLSMKELRKALAALSQEDANGS